MDDTNRTIQDLVSSALMALADGNFEKALEEFRAAEIIDRDNPAILFNIGITYTRLGLFKTAIDYYQRILSLKSGFIDLHSVKKNMGYCYIQTGNYTEALKLLDDVISVFSEDTTALNMKAYCYQQLDMNEESLATYRTILQKDRFNYNSINSAAYLMALNNTQLESAYKLAKHVSGTSSHNPAYLDTLGYICIKIGRLDEAEKYLTKALSILPFEKEIQEHYAELMKIKKK
ncbi:MAG TPA: tetratricopeptide repeat protein [Spirochaetota bacterium]|nr:tetratricopeptide repeat protein [Spirochaetota bacterium]